MPESVAAVIGLGATVATYTPQVYADHLDVYDVLELCSGSIAYADVTGRW